MKRLITLFLSFATMAVSCHEDKSKLDPFYTDKGGLDYVRIPLIKPYAALCAAGTKNWVVSLSEATFAVSVNNVEKATIYNNVILLYATKCYFNGIHVNQLWVVIIPSKHIEMGFENYVQYIDYLRKLGFKVEPKLHSIKNIAFYSEWHEIIDWNAIGK